MVDDTAGLNNGDAPKARIFISYSRKDLAFADKLDAALRARGFEPLIDRSEIYALEDWWKRIEALIAHADTVVFVLSPDAVASEVALKEVAFSASLNKRFAPILCRAVEDRLVPAELGKLNFVDFREEAAFEASADRLADALSTDIVWIRQHTEFGEAARRWAAAKAKGLLLRSPVLEEAERWIAARPPNAPAPTAETQIFVRESRQAATRRRNVLTGSLAAGLVLALGLAGLAYWQRGVAVEQERLAVEQRGIAQRNEALAKEQRDKAERNFKIAQKAAEGLVFDVAQGLRNVQGVSAEAVRRILEAARTTFDQLAAAAPEDLVLQRSRAVMLREFGDTYLMLGDLDAALKVYREAFAGAERLVAAGNDTLWQRDLSLSYSKIGNVLAAQGRFAEALKAYRDSLAITERLAAAERANMDWQYDLSITYSRVGDALLAQGDEQAALRTFRDALAIVEPHVAGGQGNAEWQGQFSLLQERIGDILLKQGKLDEALRVHRAALAITERLAAADRGNMQRQRNLSIAYEKIGNIQFRQGELDEALKTYRASLAIATQLAAADRSNAQWQHDLSISYEKVGNVLLKQGRQDEALQTYRDSLAIRAHIAATDRGNIEWQRALGSAYDKVGSLLATLGKFDEALSAHRGGLAVRQRLAADDPGSDEWQAALQITVHRLGGLSYQFVMERKFATAVAVADQALAVAPTFLWIQANRGHALMFLDRIAEARDVYRRYRDERNVVGSKSWGTVIREDFADLRKAGLSHPLMDEIGALFPAGG
jgi:tetratricopeptide (TPR) repeat protein